MQETNQDQPRKPMSLVYKQTQSTQTWFCWLNCFLVDQVQCICWGTSTQYENYKPWQILYSYLLQIVIQEKPVEEAPKGGRTNCKINKKCLSWLCEKQSLLLRPLCEDLVFFPCWFVCNCFVFCKTLIITYSILVLLKKKIHMDRFTSGNKVFFKSGISLLIINIVADTD